MLHRLFSGIALMGVLAVSSLAPSVVWGQGKAKVADCCKVPNKGALMAKKGAATKAKVVPVKAGKSAKSTVPACCVGGNCCANGACCDMPNCCKADKSCCDPKTGKCTSACGCLTGGCCGVKTASAKKS